MGEFFLFGVELDYNNKLININFTDDEFPLSEELIKKYQEYFKKQIEENNVKVVGLGVEVKVQTASNKIQDAIEIRIYHIEGVLRTFYIPYMRDAHYKFIFEGEYFE